MKRAMTVFAEQAVAYFGETKKVKEIAQTEEVVLNIKDMRMDYVFLMEDDTYTHFEFQSTDKGITDLVRFNLYDVLLYQQTKKEVYTYVIYSGDIKEPLSEYSNGFSHYKVKAICMAHKNADEVLVYIENKLKEHKPLNNHEQLDLIFTPLMSGKLPKAERIIKALNLSKEYPLDEKEDIQAMLYTFALKFLNRKELAKIKEVIKMTELGRMLIEEGREEGIEEGIEKGIEKGKEEAKVDVARALLKEGLLNKEQIARVTKLPLIRIDELEKDKLNV